MTEQTIQPCPFCGFDMSDFAGMTPDAFAKCSDGGYSLNCTDCNCIGPVGKTMPEAVALWNRRLATPHNAAVAEELPDERARAIAIIEARLPLYTDISQINALRECISSIRG